MNSTCYIEEAEKNLLHTYNRYGILLEYGKGVYLFDTEGKKYLDFAAGIGVCALGYGNEEYNDALKEQVDKLLHTSNLYYNVPAIRAAELVKQASGMDRVFFTNSGAEAVEGAIKAAKKYAYTRDQHAGHEVIAMHGSFHGRTLGALSVTGNEGYQKPFGPLLPRVRFAEFNRLESVKEQITEHTCAIIMETIQGEGGIYPAEKEFIEGIARLCREKDILLILDEIQCGMGRSGEMFAWQNYDVKPDIMTTAKALGCGVPVGAFLMTERVAEKSLAPGDHGTTYGGNPFAGAAVAKTLELMKRDRMTEHVREVSKYLWERLEELKERHACVAAHRGMGLMQGLQLDGQPAGEVSKKALAHGLILITAGCNVLRFLPPLIIEKEHVDEMTDILDRILSEEER
ncbi:MAG: aspartate aminotransferase family protein [Eubacterium sp.]|jgi:acetylornithine/N-succinyldiaminopimelate aminotransferase|nr:aspartate aminotransferase family protein [Eubacterium sp.]